MNLAGRQCHHRLETSLPRFMLLRDVKRDTALTVVLALLAVVALSVAAATLDTATTREGGSRFGAGPNTESGFGNDEESSGDVGNGGEMSGGNVQAALPCYPVLAGQSVVTGIVVVFALLGGICYWRTRSKVLSGAFVSGVGIPIAVLHALLTSCVVPQQQSNPSLIPTPKNGSSLLPGASGATGLNRTGEVLSAPSVLLGVGLLAAVVGSVVVLLLSTGDSKTEVPEAEVDPEDVTPDVAAIGRAAGAAADRIEADADVENEVFRAWTEMTRLLDVSRPQSSTAREFAVAAVDAGMARDDVEELTDLFEDVRYGGAEATAEREERALAALRRIESAYADEVGRTTEGGS